MAVELIHTKVDSSEAGLTLQQWMKQHYPHITRGLIEKHLRKGFLRVNDKKASLSQKLEKGHVVRIHPVVVDEAATRAQPDAKKAPKPYKQAEGIKLQDSVVYKDKDILVINKPAGLAVQGGTGISVSLDDMLDSLKFDAKERPKLVHRLDRDTSGVLVLARNTQTATKLTQYFREKDVQKIYWAIVKGVPVKAEGKINVPLQKKAVEGSSKEKVQKDSNGLRALTYYEVVDSAKHASWLALMPVTGRTHQLRVHCLSLGTPIIGDGKYGGREAFLEGVDRTLHLHAYQITLPLANGKTVTVKAPPPPHIKQTMEQFGFSEKTRYGDFLKSVEY